MSALVLKMTTAASSIYPKKPYQILFNSISSPSPLPNRKILVAALSQTHKYSGCRITPCAPFLPFRQNPSPRFPECFSASSCSRNRSDASGVSSEDRGESSGGSGSESGPGGGGGGALMADMGSANHKGADWYDSPLYPNQDELLSPLQHQQQKQQQLQSQSSSKFLTLPTILTLGRVASVPVLVSTFYVDSWWGTTATTSIFIAAAITDWLDGYIARKMRSGSAFGAFLDPVADKLMVAATLVLLCSRPLDVAMFGQVPWLFVVPSIAIIGREITMSAVREWAASQNAKLLEAVAVNNLGKWKTATQMIALTILLATRDNSLGRPEVLVASGVVLLYVSAGLAVWSLVVYMSKIWKVLLR
ncbi:CDP-diacylglycerol--glycerol-3-phosphate 3-phosphatidyltransferase 2-like [Pyrus ussuriensis x Pyrus communis]|uniref:CDP-diacylglycerol--glycerol-3-phosphate 1-phosphatidyltransferase n=1 Tax=Pyrus ussuriensis x Pyrus communis TaxID=2448454 RepID=A0A5N5FAK4_9ROSA|nr:CDP-diacylglycerol--glycerol-3-phosphate 3-phosphatidyltransferase 2-like [Pyrus ussuriensis x Pyrus communis]